VRAPLKSGAKKTHRPAAKAAARPPPSSVAPRPAPRPPAPTTLKRHKVPVDPTARALGVLGLAPGADGDAVRKAYRERALLFHPDKVTHLPPDLRAMAEASMRDLNRAYETLQRLGRA
jgi:DnaJ-domain-containing protein 1